MKRIILLLLVFAITVIVFATPTSAVDSNVFHARIIHSNDGAEPQAVKVCSVNDIKHYLSEYHGGACPSGIDISEYDDTFFQEKTILFSLVAITGSSPVLEITSVVETETSIKIEMSESEEPPSPDMASWILMLEIERGNPEKEIFVNACKIADVPYNNVSEHTFVNGVCTVCGATDSSNPFTDIFQNTYYYDAVLWAANQKITSGTSETTFSPSAGCTRAQVVTFLWRAAGSPEPTSTTNPFTDVTDGYYYKAVLWAAEKNITSGTSATTFSPKTTCTRAQIVTFLWRFEGSPEPTTTTNPFTDVPAEKYYTKAVLWVAEKGVTAGTSATTFSPDATCTRAQVVSFLYRDIS